MIRKQLYITEQQEHALKRRAKTLGVSEAEFIRRALDAMLRDQPREPLPRRDALHGLLDHTRRLAETHRTPAGYRFDREALYAEREEQLRPGTRR
ncbi:MAG: DNA-binding protein [Alphaproteobacteria bacterium]|nr:MAG: DNA-binding protein [Alphaproteobacteria bacterium]